MQVPVIERKTLRFGSFEADLASRELLRTLGGAGSATRKCGEKALQRMRTLASGSCVVPGK